MKTRNLSRMGNWLVVSLALTAFIYLTAPHLLPVSLYKLSLITSAAWVAYWIDRSLFPYARPDSFLEQPFSAGARCEAKRAVPAAYQVAYGLAQLRRALIVAAAMIGVALGA